MRAGGEGVAPAPTLRIADIGDARRADGRIRSDSRANLAGRAVQNAETFADHLASPDLDAIDAGQRRLFPLQARNEFGHARAVDRDADAAAIVPHPAAQTQLPGQPPDAGTKPDALDETANADQLAAHRSVSAPPTGAPARRPAPSAHRCWPPAWRAGPSARPESSPARRPCPHRSWPKRGRRPARG